MLNYNLKNKTDISVEILKLWISYENKEITFDQLIPLYLQKSIELGGENLQWILEHLFSNKLNFSKGSGGMRACIIDFDNVYPEHFLEDLTDEEYDELSAYYRMRTKAVNS